MKGISFRWGIFSCKRETKSISLWWDVWPRWDVSSHINSPQLLNVTCGNITKEQFSLNKPSTTVWNVSKYGVFSGPYFSPYSVRMRENTDQKKLRIWTLFMQFTLQILAPDFSIEIYILTNTPFWQVNYSWTSCVVLYCGRIMSDGSCRTLVLNCYTLLYFVVRCCAVLYFEFIFWS